MESIAEGAIGNTLAPQREEDEQEDDEEAESYTDISDIEQRRQISREYEAPPYRNVTFTKTKNGEKHYFLIAATL